MSFLGQVIPFVIASFRQGRNILFLSSLWHRRHQTAIVLHSTLVQHQGTETRLSGLAHSTPAPLGIIHLLGEDLDPMSYDSHLKWVFATAIGFAGTDV